MSGAHQGWGIINSGKWVDACLWFHSLFAVLFLLLLFLLSFLGKWDFPSASAPFITKTNKPKHPSPFFFNFPLVRDATVGDSEEKKMGISLEEIKKENVDLVIVFVFDSLICAFAFFELRFDSCIGVFGWDPCPIRLFSDLILVYCKNLLLVIRFSYDWIFSGFRNASFFFFCLFP